MVDKTTNDNPDVSNDTIPVHPDRFNLHQLAIAIDRDCFEAVIQGLRKCTDVSPIVKLLDGLRKESVSLTAELWRDLTDLKMIIQRDDVFKEHATVPGPEELLELMPKVYMTPEQFEMLSRDGKIETLIIRTIWTFNTILQAIGRFSSIVSQLYDNPKRLRVASTNEEEITYDVIPPSVFVEMSEYWDGVNRLIVEYIQCKSELFVQAGIDTYRVKLEQDDASDEFKSAELAVMKAARSAPGEIGRAFRWSLIRKLQLTRSIPYEALANIPSYLLIDVVSRCGVDLGVDPKLLGSLLTQMEMADSVGARVRVSDTYPIFRVAQIAASRIQQQHVSEQSIEAIVTSLRSLYETPK